MKRFSTRSYKLQVLLMQIEGIKIIDVRKEEFKGKVYSRIKFEFKDEYENAVHRIIEDYKENLGVETDRELFGKLRDKRIQLLNEYFAKKGVKINER
ncbi:MAG: hypothetical protein E6176_06005 [Clostridium celatum]|nr:hypothetical protein [Clostridium celatum]